MNKEREAIDDFISMVQKECEQEMQRKRLSSDFPITREILSSGK